MPITWSRLHELLGIDAPRTLTVDDIAQAIELDLDEDEALDFKAQLRTEEPAKVEFAKDVAAMANSGGGLIVFGIGEHEDDKRLTDEPIEIAAEPEHAIHQLLAARVRPLVRPVVEPIRRDSGTTGYLLVQVPDSSHAPHFYEHNPSPKNPPGAPYRHGSGTLMMREHDLERAYRERFKRAASFEGSLDALMARAASKASPASVIEGRNRRWILIAAQPFGSVPLGIRPPSADLARDAMSVASQNEPHLHRRRVDGPLPSLLDPILDDRRSGLRRWSFQYFPHGSEALTTSLQFADLHHNGSVVVGVPVAIPRQDSDNERIAVSLLEIERACGAAALLVREWLRSRSISSGAALRATILRTSEADKVTSLYVSRSDERGGIVHGNNPVSELEAAEATLPLAPQHEDVLRAATELALDIAHQFGQQQLCALKPLSS